MHVCIHVHVHIYASTFQLKKGPSTNITWNILSYYKINEKNGVPTRDSTGQGPPSLSHWGTGTIQDDLWLPSPFLLWCLRLTRFPSDWHAAFSEGAISSVYHCKVLMASEIAHLFLLTRPPFQRFANHSHDVYLLYTAHELGMFLFFLSCWRKSKEKYFMTCENYMRFKFQCS